LTAPVPEQGAPPNVVPPSRDKSGPKNLKRNSKRKENIPMFRSILGITTAISLTLPMAAFGQTDARETVRSTLDRYGYDVAQMETLSTSQVAEIYLTATSQDAGDVRTLLSGMGLSQDMSDTDTARSGMIDDQVRDILEAEGYDPSVIDVMTDSEVVQIYLASTSEDSPALDQQLAAMNLPREGEMSGESMDAASNIARVVGNQMQALGYSQQQIDALSDTETAEVYLAMTSDDTNEVRTAIESALAS
jgi:hypothetical protein